MITTQLVEREFITLAEIVQNFDKLWIRIFDETFIESSSIFRWLSLNFTDFRTKFCLKLLEIELHLSSEKLSGSLIKLQVLCAKQIL